MPRSKNAGRNANGLGNIRKKHISADNGTVYEYWEARVTVGFDPGTGKQLQRSITGKTQKEVTQKMKEIRSFSQCDLTVFLNLLDESMITKIISASQVMDAIVKEGRKDQIVKWVKDHA